MEKTDSGDLKVKMGSTEVELAEEELESVLSTSSTVYQASLNVDLQMTLKLPKAQLTTYAAQTDFSKMIHPSQMQYLLRKKILN